MAARRKGERAARPSRAELHERTKQALIEAAVHLIGEVGYQDCSVAKITTRAGLAQGTFYSYFASRQELFDQLLPKIGERLRAFITDAVRGSRSTLELEERSFDAFLEFLYQSPWYHRLFSEAETLAPRAFEEHLNKTRVQYRSALHRGWERDELPGYAEDELDTLAVILIALRGAIGPRFLVGKDRRRLPPDIRKTYIQFIKGGLSALAAEPRPEEPAAAEAPRPAVTNRSARAKARE